MKIERSERVMRKSKQNKTEKENMKGRKAFVNYGLKNRIIKKKKRGKKRSRH